MAGRYTLSDGAAADLYEIAEYTESRWGRAQALKYSAQLEDCLTAIASGKARFKYMPKPRGLVRMMRCQHHYIFALPPERGSTIIVAVFHERRDLMARLAERLK